MNFLYDRKESIALTENLKIFGLKPNVYTVIDEKSLIKTLEIINIDFSKKRNKSKTTIIPLIHLSCHGTKEQIILSNDDRIEYNDFGKLIKKNCNSFFYNGTPALHICMSSCYGIQMVTADNNKLSSPYAVVIGCNKSIRWEDALLGFSIFYHNFIVKNWNIVDTFNDMNFSTSKRKTFWLYISKEIDNKIKEK